VLDALTAITVGAAVLLLVGAAGLYLFGRWAERQARDQMDRYYADGRSPSAQTETGPLPDTDSRSIRSAPRSGRFSMDE
jgi:hypothetical protein